MESVTSGDSRWQRMRPWAICGVLLLATMLNYMDRQALAVTLPKLKAMFNLQEDRIGVLEGCFGFGFAFGSLLFGWLADRWGPRYLYPAVLAGWSVAGIGTALAGQSQVISLLESSDDIAGTGTYRWLVGCRVLLGICEAGHWPCALITVRAALGDRSRTLGNGILQSGASIGAILVPIYVELAEMAGQSWNFPFWSIGIVGLLWIPAWFLVIGRLGDSSAELSSESRHPGSELIRDEVASDPLTVLRQVLVLAVVVATLTISWQFLRAWLVLYLEDFHHYTSRHSRLVTSAYFVSADVGCMLSGLLIVVLTRWHLSVHQARVFGFFLFCLLTACGALVPHATAPWMMIMFLLLAGAGILGLHPYYYAMVQELPKARVGVLSGVLAAGGWVISSVSQILLGQHIKETKSYGAGLLLVGLVPLAGFLAIVLLWPRRSGRES